jgi:hypothetical protein
MATDTAQMLHDKAAALADAAKDLADMAQGLATQAGSSAGAAAPGASGGAVTSLLTPSLGSISIRATPHECSPYTSLRPSKQDGARVPRHPPAPAACVCVGWRVGGGRWVAGRGGDEGPAPPRTPTFTSTLRAWPPASISACG